MGGQGRCERRRKVLAKIQKKIGAGGRVGGGGGFGLGGQGGCDRRIEVFVKIQKKNRGSADRVGGSGWGSSWGVRVVVNEELKFLRKLKKKSGGLGRGVR